MNSYNLGFYLAIIAIAISTVSSLSCYPCNSRKCAKVTCKSGLVKDVCGCCDVCAKTEGEKCGGLWDFHGKCAPGLTCVTRTGSPLSKLKQHDAGHCEPDKCANMKCAAGQTCTMVSGQPRCNCPRSCKNTAEPVCELKMGMEFINVCYLKKYECKIGQSLDFTTGPCKKCFFNGTWYKFGETIYKKRGCQHCSCRHGSWDCRKKCEDEGSIPCKMSMVFNELVCPAGMKCLVDVTISDSNKPGICIPIEETRNTNEADHDEGKEISSESDIETPTKGTRCPAKKNCRKMCLNGYQKDSNGCDICKCDRTSTQAKKNICNLPVSEGPCANSIPRWHFNKEVGKCMKFYYGGCFGNSNNFNTKDDCQKRCQQQNQDEKKETCMMVPLHGPCNNKVKRWFFNAKTGRCLPFIYGGCGANANNFLTRKQCNHTCRNRQNIN